MTQYTEIYDGILWNLDFVYLCELTMFADI